jgi:hypothetical protein
MNAPLLPMPALVAPSGRLAPAGWLVAALFGLAATALVLYATSEWGAGVSPDSVGYVAAARSLAAGQGWRTIDGRPVVIYPPGLATFLGGIALAGPDPAVAVRYVNALAFGLTVLLAAAWLLVRLRSPALAVLGAAAVLLSQPLLFDATMAWTEAGFVLLTVLCLAAPGRHLANGGTAPVLAAGLWAGLACVTRYAGAPLLPVVLVVIALRRADPWRLRLLRGATFTALALLPVGLWLLRNLRLEGSAFGGRHAGSGDLLGVLTASGRLVAAWFVPPAGTAGFHGAALAGLGAAVLLAAVGLWAGRRRESAPVPWRPLAPWLLFGALYWLFIVAVKSRIGNLEPRYLDPLAVPLVLLLFTLLDRALASGSAGLPYPRAFAAALPLCVLLWVGAYPAPMALGYAALAHKGGVPGYSAAYWHDRPIVRALTTLRPDGYILSNAPALVYWMTGSPASSLPSRDGARGAVIRRLTDHVAAHLAAGERVYVILVRVQQRPMLTDPRELNALFEMRLLWNDPGGSGAILRVASVRNPP